MGRVLRAIVRQIHPLFELIAMWRFLFALLAVSTLRCEIIDGSRKVDWAGYAGIEGGIPHRTTIYTTLSAGASAASLQSALNSCPPNQVIKMGAGAFNFGSTDIDWSGVDPGVVWRGSTNSDGTSSTVITFSGGQIFFRSPGFSESALSVDANLGADAVKGGFTLTLAAVPSWVTVGELIGIDQIDDSSFVAGAGTEGGQSYRQLTGNGARGLGQINRVLAKNSTTITVETPLYYGFKVSQTAQIFQPGYNPTTFHPLRNCGMEDLKIVCTGSASSDAHMIKADITDSCWLKNVEIENIRGGAHTFWDFGYRGQIIHCNFHESHALGGGQGYGVALYHLTSGFLVEDCIFRALHVAMSVDYGSAGNVFGYNLELDGTSDSKQNPSMNTHGVHTYMNLWEGNWTEDKMLADWTHGSSSHNTVFRNVSTGENTNSNKDSRTAMSIEYYNRYWNVIGNIIGKATFQDKYLSDSTSTSDGSVGVIMKVGGQVNINNDYSPFDANSYTSGSFILIHGNYDTISSGQRWESAIADHSIPNSLYLSAKPSWFGDRSWPPFDPSNFSTAQKTNIPAGYRYVFGGEVPEGGGGGGGGIIPDSRRVVWQGNVGVSGGIPFYPVATNLFPAESGVTNLLMISNALKVIPNQRAVFLENGVWNMDGVLDWRHVTNSVVLRGNGPKRTKLKFITGNIYMQKGAFDESLISVDTNLTRNAVFGGHTLNFDGGVPSWVVPGGIYGLDQVDDEVYATDYGQEGNSSYRKVTGNEISTVGAFASDISGWTLDGSSVAGSSVAWNGLNAIGSGGSLRLVGNFASNATAQAASTTFALPTELNVRDYYTRIYFYVRVDAASSARTNGDYGNIQFTLLNGSGLTVAPLTPIALQQVQVGTFWFFNMKIDATNSVDDVRAIRIGLGQTNMTGPVIANVDEIYFIGGRGMNQLIKVTATNSTTVTVDLPLFWNWQTNRSAQMFQPGRLSTIYRCGLEDIGISMVYTNGDVNSVIMENAEECWVKNIWIDGTAGRAGVMAIFPYRCEIRDSFVDLSHSYGPGQGYGIALYHAPTGNLVENNIAKRMHVGFSVDYGGGGNVFGYNYSLNEFADQPQAPALNTHGTHAMFDLWEGNVTQGKILADFTHASSSHQTWFRNRIQGRSFSIFDNTVVSIEKFNRAHNVVGNILGFSGLHTNYSIGPTSDFTLMATAGCDGEIKTIYKLGFFSNYQCGNDGDPDIPSKLDVLIHANWDVVTDGQVFDPDISEHTLPDSYYLSGKPFWWGDILSFPSINPETADIDALDTIKNPAVIRYKQEWVPPNYQPVRPLGRIVPYSRSQKQL